MTTETVVPTSDESCLTVEDLSSNNCPGDLYADVDEGLGAVDNSDGCKMFNSIVAAYIEFGLGNPSFVGTCTSIRVGVRVKLNFGTTVNLNIGIYDGGAQIGSDEVIAVDDTESTEWTGSWTGLALSAADLADLTVLCTKEIDAYILYLYTLDVEITYVPLPIASINIGDDWKDVVEVKMNVGDVWKDVSVGQINIGDDWKDPTT